ncbi:MAG: efflux RND transporter periplasmic adaptor subunit [Pseudomonadales bacterium]
MQVLGFRRQFAGLWRQLSRLIAPMLIAQALLLVLMSRGVEAATAVAFQQVEHVPQFEAVRLYAGRTGPARASELGFRHAGELQLVLVDHGDRVERGQLLARLSSASLRAALRQAEAEVALATANVVAAQARSDSASQAGARFARLRTSGHVSEQEHDEQQLNARARSAEVQVAQAALRRAHAALGAAEIDLRETRLRAPFAGIVQQRHRDEGTQLAPGEPVLRLVEAARIEARVGIPESQAEHLTIGASYALRWNGRSVAATLKSVLPEVDAQTRTLTAVLALDDQQVPLGSVVELRLSQAVETPGFWLPLTSLAESDRGLWGVYVINAESTIERRLVEIVHSESDRAFVRGTLQHGDWVVTQGVHRLVPGQRVTAAERS